MLAMLHTLRNITEAEAGIRNHAGREGWVRAGEVVPVVP